MSVKLFKKNKSEVNYLDMVPVKNVDWQENEDKTITILAPRFYNGILRKIIEPKLKKPFVKINLEEFGSETWRNIDGSKDVRTIGNSLTDKFGDSIQPVYERLTKYLDELRKYEFIKLKEK